VINALKDRPDVVEVIPSGSLARSTHLGPIDDVDLIVVFDESMHPDWHGGGSAQVGACVGELVTVRGRAAC
jgi:tRNA nucleotidyltransferase (CCA-adding enzyme)